MKIFYGIAALVLSFLVSTGSCRAADFYTGTGDWNVAANWGGSIPTSSDVGVINSGSTVTFSSGDTYSVMEFAMGSNTLATAATFDITGGTLTAGISYVGRSSNLSDAVFNLQGGTLSMTSASTLNIGNNAYTGGPFTGNTSTATFSGGTFDGGLTIGNTAAQLGSSTQTGLLTIQGTGATIQTNAGGVTEGLTINTTGTLAFNLAASGVSNVNYRSDTAAGALTFLSGGTLSVNASSFTSYGSVSTIALIDYANGSSVSGFSNLTLSITGVESGYTASIVNDVATDSINLDIAAVPEPSVTLLFLLGCGIVFVGTQFRRRVSVESH